MEIFLIIGGVVGFLAFWCLIIFLIAKFGGWKSLAEKHMSPDHLLQTSEKFSFQSITVGVAGVYSNCVNVYVSAEGFAMRPVFFFRFQHSMIFIRWSEMEKVEYKNLLGRSAKITLKDGSKFNVLGASVKAIRKFKP